MQKWSRIGILGSTLLILGFGCATTPTTTLDTAGTEPVVVKTTLKLIDGTYTVLLDESVVGWSAYRVRYGNEGTLGIKQGSISIQDGIISSAEIVLDMEEIHNTDMVKYPARVKKLEADLISENFFDVENYPTAVFTLSSATRVEETQFDFTGILLMKDNEGIVDFSGEITNEGDNLRLVASFTIDRTEWGITYGSGKFFDNLGDLMISDEITIDLAILATP